MMRSIQSGFARLWVLAHRCTWPLLVSAAMLDTASAALPRPPNAQGRPRPAESHPGIDVALGELTLDSGLRVRTIVSSPNGPARGPAVLVVPWLSCASVETPADETDGMSRLIIDLVTRSGAHVWRVDKPGVGDSEGRCDQTDFQQELEAYRKTFQAMRRDVRTDPSRVVVVGISNGGGIAPLVTDAPVAGYVSVGGWSGSWLEHAVWQERRRLERQSPDGLAPVDELARWQRLYAGILLEGRSPGEMVDRHPELAALWRWGRDSQYGRPSQFYRQLQQLDLAAAWLRVKVPTLAVWGSEDAVMSREESERIVSLANRGLPAQAERARLIVVPGADHGLRRGTGPYAGEVGDRVVAFVRRVTVQAPERAASEATGQRVEALLAAMGGRALWAGITGMEVTANHEELRRESAYRSTIRNDFREPRVAIVRDGPGFQQQVELQGRRAWKTEAGQRRELDADTARSEWLWWESNVYRTLVRLAARDPALRPEWEGDRLVVYRPDHTVLNWLRLAADGSLREFGTRIDAPGVLFGPLKTSASGARYPAWTAWPNGLMRALDQAAQFNLPGVSQPVQDPRCWHADAQLERAIGYCQVVRQGRTLHVSGVAAGGDMASAVRQVYAQLRSILESQGVGAAQVLRENVYTTDIEAFKAASAGRRAFYGDALPAASWVQVARLFLPEFVVEVELEAASP